MRYNILYIDEYEIRNLELSGILYGLDVNIINAKNERQAQDIVKEIKEDFNLIIWIINSDDKSILSSIKWLKSRDALSNIPVIAVCERINKSFITKVIESGVDEYIVWPFENDIARRKVYKVLGIQYKKSIQDKVDDIVYYNFSDMFNKEISAASRGGYPLSIMLITLHTKSPLKGYDESCCDAAKDLKRVLKTRFRKTDSIFHFEKNKLLVILPFANKERAENIERKAKRTFSSHSVMKKYNNGICLNIISATFPDDGRTKSRLFNKLQGSMNIQGVTDN